MSDLYLTLDQSNSAPISLALVEESPVLNINVSEMVSPIALELSPVVVGMQGIQGERGREVSLRVSDGYIQWQYTDDTSWQNLISVSSLVGNQGESAYDVAVSEGFLGDVSEWLASLVGAKGEKGNNGTNGLNGADGLNGASAYEVAVSNGFSGTVSQWLLSLVGAKGDKGDTGSQGPQGAQGIQGASGTNGVDGEDGISAYQVAVNNGFSGTESQWLASLIGAKGDKGDTGATGSIGLQGSPGLGLASGGTTGQFVRKKSTTDYDTEWHSLTKSDVGLGSVVNTDTTTTANISDSTDKRFVTDAQKTVIQNTSGSNTGDETSTSIKTKLGISTLSGSNTGDQDLSSLALKSTTINSKGLSANIVLTQDDIGDGTTYKQYSTTEKSKLSGIASGATVGADWNVNVSNKPTLGTSAAKDIPSSGNASTAQVVLGSDTRLTDARTPTTHFHAESDVTNLVADLASKVAANDAITGATKTKITYDSKGLVTAGADATTADIASSTDKRYVTDAQLVVIGSTSGSNTGDETASTIKTKLGAATASADGYATAAQITKLDGIATGAEVNVNADWNSSSGDSQILNKPTLGTAAAKDIPSSGNATSTQVVLGNDTRLSDSRTPSAHTHAEAEITNLSTDLAAKVTGNTAITGATKTKITYDSKGLVTGGADATTADVADSTNKRYVSDAQLSVIGNTSGTNTGDQTLPTDATLVFTDVTTNNASTSKHGFLPKLPTPTGKYLKDDLTWGSPEGGSGSSVTLATVAAMAIALG